MRKLLTSLACLAALPVYAEVRPIMAKYDLDSTTEITCVLDPADTVAPGRATTSGSSATVTAVGSATPFTNILANARVVFSSLGKQYTRTAVAVASGTSMTIDTATDLSTSGGAVGGYEVSYRNITCGSGAENGWFSIAELRGLAAPTIDFNITQQNTTGGIDVRVQCRSADANALAVQVLPALTPPAVTATYLNYTGTGGFKLAVPEKEDQCRVLMLIHTNDDGNDATTNREQVSVTLSGDRR